MVGLNVVDTHLAEVLSTAAGEVWVSSQVPTERTQKMFNWINKLTLIAAMIGTCHFSLLHTNWVDCNCFGHMTWHVTMNKGDIIVNIT